MDRAEFLENFLVDESNRPSGTAFTARFYDLGVTKNFLVDESDRPSGTPFTAWFYNLGVMENFLVVESDHPSGTAFTTRFYDLGVWCQGLSLPGRFRQDLSVYCST
ncbi:hypothetical protein LR48_Vigan02g037200 [Vigna angularis]|uniref:Uncharacterized protein n=1 Tax=Phaseolus angularis TaxID=3914 RepID=A0A0L9TUZ1_PHAAN|nr:hypothetical protein LR48_Vigan02g037200 [Vigna angularis]